VTGVQTCALPIYAVTDAEAGVAGNDDMRPDAAARTDLDMLADDGIGADLDIRGDTRAGVD
jgi:hypothetical protein